MTAFLHLLPFAPIDAVLVVPGAATVAVRPATGMAAVFALLPAAQTLMVAFAAERVENAGTPVRSNKITRSE